MVDKFYDCFLKVSIASRLVFLLKIHYKHVHFCVYIYVMLLWIYNLVWEFKQSPMCEWDGLCFFTYLHASNQMHVTFALFLLEDLAVTFYQSDLFAC